MSKRTSKHAKSDSKPAVRPDLAAVEQHAEEPIERSPPSGSAVAVGADTIATQAEQLCDSRLQSAQRRVLASQIGRLQGNRHLQHVVGVVHANRKTSLLPGSTSSVQRHQIEEAPPLPEDEPVQARFSVQRSPADVKVWHGGGQAAFGKVGRNGLSTLANGSSRDGIQRWKIGGKTWGIEVGSKGVGVTAGGYEAKWGPLGLSFGKVPTPITFGKVTFKPSEVPADGKTTATATVKATPEDRPIKWGFVGPDYGSTIDAKGVITPGADLKGKEKVALQVKAFDEASAKSQSVNTLTLWDAEHWKAKDDYEQLIKGGPYKFPAFRPTNWSFDGKKFTAYNWGAFDAEYHPKDRLLDVKVRVKFAFIDDRPKKTDSVKAKEEREKRHKAYASSFAQQVQTGWGGKFAFRNVRAPQSVWGKLNPVRVQLNVQNVEHMKKVGGKTPGQHWLIKVRLKTTGIAEVEDATRLVKFFKGDDKAQAAFNPSTMKGELARLRRITPQNIYFKPNKFDLEGKYKAPLQFLGSYLKRMNTPQFKLTITGHASTPGKDVNVGLSQKRAQAVERELKAGGVTNHPIVATGVGGLGASPTSKWQKATTTSAVAGKGWKNFQDVTLHEFGHMIGLDDEYTRKGDTRKLADHYMLIKKAFGEDYAKQVSKIGDTQSASVMYGGNEVRIHHYVTFWEALYRTTETKAPVPKERFGFKDWKFAE
jgi:outer membrane protein OmpA-like peptidoglycan-associated protein